MIEYVDSVMLVFILSTVIFLVKKTTTLCHDVEALEKRTIIYWFSFVVFSWK